MSGLRAWKLAVSAAAILLLAACGGETSEKSPRLASSAEFAAAVARRGAVTINVHVPDEGSLRGTDLWIPFDALERRREELPPRTTPLAVYCRTGHMSAVAVDVLAGLGYEDVVELDGGMVAWERSGRPLLPPRRP